MLSLAIHHNVWLTRDQRYALHDGIDLVVVGLYVPVWVSNQRATSEPAKELFCKYYLKNPKTDEQIQIVKDGYEITLPNRQGNLPNLTDEEWRDLNLNNPDNLKNHYSKCDKAVNSNNLLDTIDGGSKHLSFREHNKIENETINVIHFINMVEIEELTKSLI